MRSHFSIMMDKIEKFDNAYGCGNQRTQKLAQ
jgi:hypothetical protein